MALPSTVEHTPTVGVEADSWDVSAAWRPRFPTVELVESAASLLTPRPKWRGNEGPRARFTVGPGMVAISRRDPARAERSETRAREAVWTAAKLAITDGMLPTRLEEATERATAVSELYSAGLVAFSAVESELGWLDHLDWRRERLEREDAPLGATITSWSRKSRARMVRKLTELDYAPLFATGETPGMVTVTYPGDWLAVAPTPAVVSGHVHALRARFQRAYGRPLIGTWKREFQRRGAPHYHVLMVPPTTPVLVPGPRPMVPAGVPQDRGWVGTGRARPRPHRGFVGPMPERRTRFVGPLPEKRVPMVGPVAEVVSQTFPEWLSWNWADIVGASSDCGCDELDQIRAGGLGSCRSAGRLCRNSELARHRAAGTGVDYAEGLRASDPKRLAVYFSKHGSFAAKDYQNDAPAEWSQLGGVGRFWGVWGLESGARDVEISDVEALAAVRTMRRWQNANGYRVQRTVWRESVNKRTGELRRRARKSGSWSGARIRGSAGFVAVNDGPAFVSQLSRYLDLVREDAQAAEVARWLSSPARVRRLDLADETAAAAARRCCVVCGSRLAPELVQYGSHLGDCGTL